MGAEMQKRTLVATCIQPLNQPRLGWTSLDSQAYEAPQSGSRRLSWKYEMAMNRTNTKLIQMTAGPA